MRLVLAIQVQEHLANNWNRELQNRNHVNLSKNYPKEMVAMSYT